MKWNITYFNSRVFKGINALPKKIKARFVALTERMIQVGPDLGMPHTKAMGDGLFELRVKAQEGIARVFYCTVVNREIVVLHAFIKKTQATPKKELDIAIKRLKEVTKNG
jgi:phage-related protein